MRLQIFLERPITTGMNPGWWKHVTKVDLTKRDGYAFEGSFLDTGTHALPIGAVLVLKAPTGNAANQIYKGAVYRMGDDGNLKTVLEVTHWSRDFLRLREAVCMELATPHLPAAKAPPASCAVTPPALLSAMASVTDQDLINELRRRPDAWALVSDSELVDLLQRRGYRV